MRERRDRFSTPLFLCEKTEHFVELPLFMRNHLPTSEESLPLFL